MDEQPGDRNDVAVSFVINQARIGFQPPSLVDLARIREGMDRTFRSAASGDDLICGIRQSACVALGVKAPSMILTLHGMCPISGGFGRILLYLRQHFLFKQGLQGQVANGRARRFRLAITRFCVFPSLACQRFDRSLRFVRCGSIHDKS